jgi:hypothetical protein
MADNYLLVKGENGYTIKQKLFELDDGMFAIAPAIKSGVLLPTAKRTTTTTTDDQKNYHAKGVIVVLDVTDVDSGSLPSLTLTIQGKVYGKYYDILESTAVTGKNKYIYKVHPAFTASANLIAKDVIPLEWRVVVTHGNANEVEYSVGYSTVL